MLVSILIPAHNAAPWIAETLRSALDQTWKNTEIIVVDDGSTDETLTIAKSFESPRLKVVTQPCSGAAASRNAACDLSQGDYIQWLDADDLLGPDKVERQMEVAICLGDKRVLLSSGWAAFSRRPSVAQFCQTALWCDQSPADWLVNKLGGNLHMQTATWLTSRELATAGGRWNAKMLSDDDGEYYCRVLAASKEVKFVPEAKVYYRTTDRGRLSLIGSSDKKKDAMLASMQVHIATLRAMEESERVRRACLQYLQNWLPAFYPERPDIVDTMKELAGELGGGLAAPRLSWKYSWIQKLLGWKAAKQAQLFFPYLRLAILKDRNA